MLHLSFLPDPGGAAHAVIQALDQYTGALRIGSGKHFLAGGPARLRGSLEQKKLRGQSPFRKIATNPPNVDHAGCSKIGAPLQCAAAWGILLGEQVGTAAD